MSKLLLVTVFLTLTPGYLWWIVVAALMPGLLLLMEDLGDWLDRSRRRALVPVRVERFGRYGERRRR